MSDVGNDAAFNVSEQHQDPWKQKRSAKGAWIAITFIVAALVITVAIIQGAYHRTRGVPELPEPRKV